MESTEQKTPETELVIKLKTNSYTLKFPDTGQLIDLEQAKSRIQVPKSGSVSAVWAYNLAISIETFSILIPQLKEDINVKSLYKLSLMESREFVKVYLDVFRPWFDEWMNIVSSIFDEDEASKNNE